MVSISIPIDKIERESVTQKVVAALRNHILSGEIEPGTRLIESRLARQFGISRAPLREAFLILEREGLVTSEHAEGTFVAEISEDDLRDIFLVRGVLEGLAMRLAAENVTEEHLDQLSRIVEWMQEAASRNDAERVVELDLQFHELIWRISRCKRLDEILHNMIGPIRMFLALNTQVYDDLVDNVLEHVTLLEAFSSGDVERAREMMIAHIEEAGQRNIAYIQAADEES
jgi:DNA-binding GntR family transcriptional regulator